MLSLRGNPRQLCDGIARREVLRLGSLGALGLSLPGLWQVARAAAPEHDQTPGPRAAGFGQAKACIMIYLFGGPSQIDTFDMKPQAPPEFRGEFAPIATSLPGTQVCEHFSQLARQYDKLCLVRSMHHEHPRHGYGLYYMFTGREHARPDLDAAPAPHDDPSLPALVAHFRADGGAMPPAVTLPRWNRFLDLPQEYAGETAGYLGRALDPWLIRAEPNSTEFHVAGVDLPHGITLDRLAGRQALWQTLDRGIAAAGEAAAYAQQRSLYHRAFELIGSTRARQAFDLSREQPAVRDRYGPSPFGQGLLMARRLVEAGVHLVTVNWHDDGSDVKSPFWDTHKDNFKSLKNQLIPPVDAGLSALLEDLDQRGLLDSTLVVVMGEFGRTPRIGRVVMNTATNPTGRDHWPHAYSVLLAGGPMRRGFVYGASDDRAAYVVDNPVRPPDLVATILHALGCNPRQTIYDLAGRPRQVCEGRVVSDLFA